jgi:hypothetical protein
VKSEVVSAGFAMEGAAVAGAVNPVDMIVAAVGAKTAAAATVVNASLVRIGRLPMNTCPHS